MFGFVIDLFDKMLIIKVPVKHADPHEAYSARQYQTAVTANFPHGFLLLFDFTCQ